MLEFIPLLTYWEGVYWVERRRRYRPLGIGILRCGEFGKLVTGSHNLAESICDPYKNRFRMIKSTPNRKMIMDILFIPCIIRMLMLVGLDPSFLLKKYPPTSPSEKNSRIPFFLDAPVF